MNRSHAWPLVLFTLAAQAGAGAVAIAAVLRIARGGDGSSSELTIAILAATAALCVIGNLAAIFHLGRPLRAISCLANLQTSWLSREIAASLSFGASVLVTAGLHVAGAADRPASVVLLGVSAVLGAVLVYCMARLYMLRTIPNWHAPATMLAFSGTAVALGLGLVTAVAASIPDTPPALLRGLAALTAVAVVLRLAVDRVRPGPRTDSDWAASARAALGLLAMLFLAGLAGTRPDLPVRGLPGAALTALWISEVLDRRRFFALYARPVP